MVGANLDFLLCRGVGAVTIECGGNAVERRTPGQHDLHVVARRDSHEVFGATGDGVEGQLGCGATAVVGVTAGGEPGASKQRGGGKAEPAAQRVPTGQARRQDIGEGPAIGMGCAGVQVVQRLRVPNRGAVTRHAVSLLLVDDVDRWIDPGRLGRLCDASVGVC